ncbi:MAG: polysaccharide pyruvyl transferase CsaB [Elusimicrobia bacterium RIFOXYD2_FULL_34_15]|nr:MAG: polysaccharide pyruvyl transferase CsaB [Elusimicrobia bacterium RIFOXYD2_FULL_34_15]
MSEIVISGYYGYNNVGDELILKSIVNDLKTLNPDITITVLSVKPKETSRKFNVKSINRYNICSILVELVKCKMLISGSGGLFQDTTASLSLWYYLTIINIAKILNRKVFIYAVGIGGIKRSFNKFLIKSCFNKVDFISVRTDYDKNILESFMINREIIVTADPVFGIVLPIKIKDNQQKVKKIGIIIRKTKYWKEDTEIFSKLSEILTEKPGTEVILIPFQKSSDLRILETIKKKSNAKISILLWENIEDILNLFSQLDLVVSMRLHGLILAIKYNIPFVPISRYSKLINLMKTIEEKNILQATELNAENIYTQITNKISNKNDILIKNNDIIIKLENNAKKTANLCISMLTN